MRVDVGNPLWRFRGIRAATWLFFAYLYLPIVVLIVLSFNENRLATIWSGFSTQWYGVVLGNDDIIRAATNSLVVATVATLAATLAARSDAHTSELQSLMRISYDVFCLIKTNTP